MIAQQQSFDIFDQPFPVMKLEDVVLRQLETKDALDLLEYLSHEEVRNFISEEDLPRNLQEATNEVHYWGGLFQHRQSIYWGIAEKDSNQLIGTCGFNYWNRMHHKVEISYDLSYDYWHKGYMSQSLRAIIAFGFEKMQLHRIGATVSPDNEASIKLLERLGFMYEGRMRGYKIVQDKLHDALVYSIIRDDYNQIKHDY